MIVKDLELTNIRSHAHSLIRFPLGKTLLEGDIGAGKSSVLIAIEFALFGMGSDSGASLVKLGCESGEVRMTFDVGGEEYEVSRRLVRKGGKVQQSDGYLKTPAETLNLSPSELKERVLEVLEFNEVPDPKAQSWIYRYAVYTPQEEMKHILTLAPEQRLQILRRAFRVEDYKIAATNAEDAARQTRVDASRLDGISEGVDELKKETDDLQKEEEKHQGAMTRLEHEVVEAEKRVAAIRVEREEIRKMELGLQGTKVEKEYYERIKGEAAKDAAELGKETEALLRELVETERLLKEAEETAKGSKSAKAPGDLKRKERSLEEKARKLVGVKATIEAKVADYESLAKNGICPVCDRPVEAHDFEERKTAKGAELEHVDEKMAEVERLLAEAREDVERAERHREAKRSAALHRSARSKLRAGISKRAAAKQKLLKREAFAERTLKQLGVKLVELAETVAKGRDAEKRLAEAESALRKMNENLVKVRAELESVQKQITKIAIQIVAKEEASNKSRTLREKEIWLEDYFVPTVKLIERSVLATINQEFDSLFKRWFGMLVSDPDKEVGIDGDFTPVVTQGGYEQDVKFLSGGERTSVALAYRLALNVLAQQASAGMKSNLLILDEPTDGFSKEQLGNVREVLDEVGCPQVIIVSHDKELESFADQIFKVDKAGSDSVVSSGTLRAVARP